MLAPGEQSLRWLLMCLEPHEGCGVCWLPGSARWMPEQVCLLLILSPLSTLLSPGALLAANPSLVVHILWLESSGGHVLGDVAAPRCCVLSQARKGTALITQLHDGCPVAFPQRGLPPSPAQEVASGSQRARGQLTSLAAAPLELGFC